MKTLLVLAGHPGFAAAVRAALDPHQFRMVAQAELREAEPFLRSGFIDACVLDADLNRAQPIRAVEELRALAPRCPLILYASAAQGQWEEEAYLMGVAHVLSKPVRARLLHTVLQRLWAEPQPEPGAPTAPVTAADTRVAHPSPTLSQTLEALRDFSGILCHSLCTEALLNQFLLLVRGIIGVNRAAIFLRRPSPSLHAVTAGAGDRRLHAACAIGIASTLLEHFELSLEAGIGGYVFRQARILRSNSEESQQDREIQKEFELLGARVAIPILDRESLVGVAVFDHRLTGEPFANEELSLIFHLLEQLGLAIKNSWLHDQLAANHEIMTDILSELDGGIVVIGRNLEVLHANRAARAIFSRKEGYVPKLEFSDLPQALASSVFETLKNGQILPGFKYVPKEVPDAPQRCFWVKISPFRGASGLAPNAVLLLIEDVTQAERAQQLEIESANLRLVRKMSEHLAHEIGNSIVPLSTHQQLFQQHSSEPDFQESLNQVLDEGVRRIGRLSSQMLFLARDAFQEREGLPLPVLVEEAFAVAKSNFAGTNASLRVENPSAAVATYGDPAALRHALSEILLNALQANPANPQATVRFRWEKNGSGTAAVHIDVRDGGAGFTEAAQQKAFEPFFTTRTVGLGLGLTVARKIIEAHRGQLEIISSPNRANSLVCISLPLWSPAPKEPRTEPGQN